MDHDEVAFPVAGTTRSAISAGRSLIITTSGSLPVAAHGSPAGEPLARSAGKHSVPGGGPHGPGRTGIGRSSRATSTSSDRLGSRYATAGQSARGTRARPAILDLGHQRRLTTQLPLLWSSSGKNNGSDDCPAMRREGPVDLPTSVVRHLPGHCRDRPSNRAGKWPSRSPDKRAQL